MNIVRDNCDERQTRVDRMIAEFREAQSRRLTRRNTVHGEGKVVEPQRDAPGAAAVAESATSQ